MARTRAGSGQIQPNLKITGDQGIIIPVGTTAQRNPSPEPGEVRFNTDLATFEGYTGQIWGGMGPFPFVKSEYFEGDGSTYSFALEQQVSNPEDLTVLINGIQLRAGIDFIIVGQRNVVFEEEDGTINPPNNGAEISIRYFVPITSASVIANSISVEELAVVPGTAGQLLSIDQNQDLVFTNTLPDTSVGVDQLVYTGSTGVDGQALLKNGAGFEFGEVSRVSQNAIGIRELNVSDGQIGQVLATDGNGNLTFITISGGGSGVGAVGSFFDLSGTIAYNQIPDNIIDIAKLDVADGTAGQLLATDGNGNLQFVDGGVGSGATTASNLGSGNGLFVQKVDDDLQFKGIVAGSGISIIPSGDSITITNSSPNIAQNTFNVVTVAGQSSLAADSVSDTLTFVAGNNITITTDPGSDSITINSTAAGGLTQNLFETIAADSGSTTADAIDDTLTVTGGTDISTSIVGDVLTIDWTGTAGDPDQNVFTTISSDSGTTTANSTTDQLNIVGGTDVSTSISGDTLTINYTGAPAVTNSFASIAVAGQATVAADSSTDTLTLVAGSNVTITSDATTDTITINASAGSGGSGTVGSGTANHLAYYPNDGTTIADTGPDLQWDSGTDTLSVVGTIDATTVQADTLTTTGVGVPTFTSGSDIIFDAASGAGNIDVGGSRIIDVGTPTANTDAVNKAYVDAITPGDPDQNLFATVAADTGSTTANTTTDTLTVSGGTDISTTIVGDTLTVAFTGTIPADVSDLTDTGNLIPADVGDLTDTGNLLAEQNLFAQVDGDTGSTTANTTADVLTIAGGTDITTSVSGDTVTINFSGTTNPPTLPAITQLEVTPYFSLAYRFDQYGITDNPTIYAISGTTIAFDLTLVTPSHPFAIEDSGGNQYNDGLVHIAPNGTVSTGASAQGKIEGVLYWKIPIGTTGNYFYQCTFHPAMRGTIAIKNFVTL